ncbi:uncharacterized protein FOMMEDRAFT_160114 [Fomitiporia mediterranea MF3/22]|uniref:uncharacterized protein n=1 Tax=Fomitiporia mediterranea (strain MF3/22) TaxID=694068 RepID=UPI0004409850|nr:uncharacterized protein FOMMEDRAFT_160114 [Fomitiporia mediterranea MF3/22]EJC99688.1 hypothetical protein FOMMEDRAFT_160114 [Fomitiporia mediterranea MF3/22]
MVYVGCIQNPWTLVKTLTVTLDTNPRSSYGDWVDDSGNLRYGMVWYGIFPGMRRSSSSSYLGLPLNTDTGHNIDHFQYGCNMQRRHSYTRRRNAAVGPSLHSLSITARSATTTGIVVVVVATVGVVAVVVIVGVVAGVVVGRVVVVAGLRGHSVTLWTRVEKSYK